MNKPINPLLRNLLAISLSSLLLSACGSDSKPNIIIDNTDGNESIDEDDKDKDDKDSKADIGIFALLSESYIDKYENGSYAVDKFGNYSCSEMEMEPGTTCGLLQYTITGDFGKLGNLSPDTPVTIDYELVSTTGDISNILKDPSTRTGTVTLHKDNTQQTLNFLLQTDNAKTGDWSVKLVLSNPSGGGNIDDLNTEILTATVIDVQSIDSDGMPATIGGINDTGVSFSGNMMKGNETTCAVSPNGKQDCAVGRDAMYSDDTDGVKGFSFTKLDSQGQALPASATEWHCVKDNVTGNIWEHKTFTPEIEGKTGDEAKQNKDYRDISWDYTYHDATLNLGSATNGNKDCKLGDNTCNTANYISKMNSETVCGISTWRLPTRMEMLDMVNLGGNDGYQTLHADWLFSKNGSNDEREWKNYHIPTSFWTSSVAAKFDSHDGYSEPSTVQFNNVWVMFSDGSLAIEDPSSAYSTAAILAVSSQ